MHIARQCGEERLRAYVLDPKCGVRREALDFTDHHRLNVLKRMLRGGHDERLAMLRPIQLQHIRGPLRYEVPEYAKVVALKLALDPWGWRLRDEQRPSNRLQAALDGCDQLPEQGAGDNQPFSRRQLELLCPLATEALRLSDLSERLPPAG